MATAGMLQPEHAELMPPPAGDAKEAGASEPGKDSLSNGAAAGHEPSEGGSAHVGAVQAAPPGKPPAASAEDAKALSAAYDSLGDAALPYVPFAPLFMLL